MKFFSFGTPGTQTPQYLVMTGANKKKYNDDLLWQFATAKKKAPSDLSFQTKGKKKVDVMYAEAVMYVVNQKVSDLIAAEKFTGVNTFPVAVVSSKEPHYGITFEGVASEPCDIDERDAYFKAKSWDGKDFFSVKDTQLTLVSARVERAFAKAKITGVYFLPVDTK